MRSKISILGAAYIHCQDLVSLQLALNQPLADFRQFSIFLPLFQHLLDSCWSRQNTLNTLKPLKANASFCSSLFEEAPYSVIDTRMGDFIDREAQLDDEEEEFDEELDGENGEARRKSVVGGKKQRDFEDSSEEEDDDDDEEAAKVCFTSW